MVRADRTCPLCGNQRPIGLYTPKRSPGPVGRCSQCGMVYIYDLRDSRSIIGEGPILETENRALLQSTDLQDLAGCWELDLLPAKELERPAIELNAANALSRLEDYLRPPGRLLDFGCGWGIFLGVAKARGWQPFGLEPLPGHALYARSTVGATVVADILRADTFHREMFDVITAFQVFEHLPDPRGELAKLRRLLRPGGLVLIEVPNIDAWGVRLLHARHRHFVADHLNFFSDHTLRQLLMNQGFQIMTSYFPARRLSVRHVTTFWGGRYLPQPLQRATIGVARRLGLEERLISVNLGDIVAVIGRKPASAGHSRAPGD